MVVQIVKNDLNNITRNLAHRQARHQKWWQHSPQYNYFQFGLNNCNNDKKGRRKYFVFLTQQQKKDENCACNVKHTTNDFDGFDHVIMAHYIYGINMVGLFR